MDGRKGVGNKEIKYKSIRYNIRAHNQFRSHIDTEKERKRYGLHIMCVQDNCT